MAETVSFDKINGSYFYFLDLFELLVGDIKMLTPYFTSPGDITFLMTVRNMFGVDITSTYLVNTFNIKV